MTCSIVGANIEPTPMIKNLQSHADPYVTVSDLARYWNIGRKLLYKQIDAGTLTAIRLGPRLIRIRTVDAFEFGQCAKMGDAGGCDFLTPSAAPLQADLNLNLERVAKLTD